MEPSRWSRIWELFEAARARSGAARAAFLEEACGDDDALRQEVESLLSSDEDAGPFLEEAVVEAAGAVPAAVPAAGRRIGPYETVRELGHGGMGTVYLAVRADDQFRRRVAIKVVRGGLHTPELLARFRSERQILADLDHPHIARMLDGGTTDDGSPYVVMEYIEGEPIDRFCDASRLSTGQRLELFRKVCSAVHYAHQNLVVHRDIKPANILVTAGGTPKLLDFGIAKLLDPAASPHTVAETATAARLLTPEYASPEQVRGRPITTASDVYSLGVLLYELLTGRLPYRLERRTPAEVERAICESNPERPSTAVTTQERAAAEARATTSERLSRQLAGDLDNIVLMALRKEPERRYASAEQLAGDLRRYQVGLPVLARKDTWAYRTRKFVGRNPVGVAAAAGLAVLLIGFALYTARQSARVAAQRDRALAAEGRARTEADTARQVSDFLVELFKVSDPSESRGEEITAREMLDRGAARIAAELAGQPAVQAHLMDTMARVYKNLGLYEDAADLANQGLELRRSLHGEAHSDVTESLATVGAIEQMRGRYDEAGRLLDDVLRRRRAGGASAELVAALNQVGWLRAAQGRYEEARTLHQESLDLARRIHGEASEETATAMNNLAQVLQEVGEYDAAERLLRDGLALRREILGENSPGAATNLNNLGQLLDRVGRLDEAEEFLRANLEVCRTVYPAGHPTIGLALTNLASVLKSRAELPEAEALQREANDLFRQVHGDEHPLIALGLNNLANLRHDQGDYEEAERLHRQSLAMGRKLYGDEHPRIADNYNNLGNLLWDKGDHVGAAEFFRQALALDRKLLGEPHPYVAMDMNALAMALHGAGRSAEAEDLHRRAIAMSAEVQGPDNTSTAIYQGSLGALLVDVGRPQEAMELLRRAEATFTANLPAGHWHIMQARANLAHALALLGRLDEALPMARSSYEALVQQRGARSGITRRARARLEAVQEAASSR